LDHKIFSFASKNLPKMGKEVSLGKKLEMQNVPWLVFTKRYLDR
jgi:hypothetical protein